MIRHIVLWKLKDGVSKEDLNKLKEMSENLKKLDGVVSLDFIIDPLETSTRDLCLHSVFKSKEALDAYQVSPVHLEFGAFLKTLVCERIAYDYAF